MARHVPDDFSFLPTVDSTDEEIVESEVPKSSKPPQAETRAPKVEPVVDRVPAKEPVYKEPPVAAPSLPIPAQVTPPAKKERVVEPQVAHSAPAPPVAERTSQAWSNEPAFPSAKLLPPKEPPVAPKAEDVTPLPTPLAPQPVRLRDEKQSSPVAAATPLVSLGGAAGSKKSKEPGDSSLTRRRDTSSDDKPKGGKEPKADNDAKPFVAPKAAPEEPLAPDEVKKRRWQKLVEKVGLRTLGMSVGVHLFLLLIATFIGVSHVMDRQVDFLPGGSSAQSQAASEALTHKIQNKKNTWLKERPQQRKITVQSLSADIVLPEMPAMDMMDFSKINNQMNISKAGAMGASKPLGMGGAGGGFGAGIGQGGKFSFVGQTALGRRVVFVVDVSGSMSAIGKGETISRFDLLKKELVKSMTQMPMGTAYQVLFFSDFAWPHNEVDSRSAEALVKYRWEIDPKDYKRVKIPTFKYIQATPFSVQDSKKIIEASDNPGGTNWGAGLLMALSANPKPDVIFFMTDGNRSDEMGWIDIVTAENKRKLPMTAIYTSAMQQPDAAPELDTLAKRNNGKFTVVLGEGKVIKGEDFFKMKK